MLKDEALQLWARECPVVLAKGKFAPGDIPRLRDEALKARFKLRFTVGPTPRRGPFTPSGLVAFTNEASKLLGRSAWR